MHVLPNAHHIHPVWLLECTIPLGMVLAAAAAMEPSVLTLAELHVSVLTSFVKFNKTHHSLIEILL